MVQLETDEKCRLVESGDVNLTCFTQRYDPDLFSQFCTIKRYSVGYYEWPRCHVIFDYFMCLVQYFTDLYFIDKSPKCPMSKVGYF